jgi:hypothetical protein
MLYSYYYVTLPYNYVYDTDECGITSFLKHCQSKDNGNCCHALSRGDCEGVNHCQCKDNGNSYHAVFRREGEGLKKYNFDILLPMPIPKTINKSTYLICIPINHSNGFLDLFEEECCRYTFLKTENIDITDIEQKYVNEISLWNGCYFETEYFISSKSNADN